MNYPWGSSDDIPRFLGLKNKQDQPFAEVWMGVHPKGPSKIEQTGELLEDLLNKNTHWGAFPFLLKLLAAGKALSIQVHPTLEQARSGYKNEEGIIPIDHPQRNYKDPNHKPEIMYALTPFKGMCGFRPEAEIERHLKILTDSSNPVLSHTGVLLSSAFAAAGYKGLTLSLLDAPGKDICEAVRLFSKSWKEHSVLKYIIELVKQYPNDSSILFPLFLNIVELEPGDVLFIPAGVMHAYIQGFGVELMANSDNVIRGGLTSKHIDRDELSSIVRFESTNPDLLEAEEIAPGVRAFPVRTREFQLLQLQVDSDLKYQVANSSILLITVEGLTVNDREVSSGDSYFLPPGTDIHLTGMGRALLAQVPEV